MTLGEWLNRVILDDGPTDDPDTPAWEQSLETFPGFSQRSDEGEALLRGMVDRLSQRLESTEQSSAEALEDIDTTLETLNDRLDAAEKGYGEESRKTREAVERARSVAEALAMRVKRLEETGTELAPETTKALETAFGRLATRLYRTETETGRQLHETGELARRADETARTLSEKLVALEARSQALDADLKRSGDRERLAGEALNGLHSAIDRLRRRLEATEGLSHDAARTIDESVVRLDTRLRAVEARANSNDPDGLNQRFDRFADEVARIVSDTRADFARQIERLEHDRNPDRFEQQLKATERRISEAESRHSEALSKIGIEITRLARVMDDRLRDHERQLNDRERDSRSERELDRRLDAVRDESRAGIRQMGDEITRLGQSLTERVAESEQKSAAAIEASSKRMTEALEKIERARSTEDDLESRLLRSEERTAERIKEALAGIGERLSAARQETEEALTPVQRAMNALADRLEAIEQARHAPEPAPVPEPAAASSPARAEREIPDFDTPLAPPPEAETPMGAGEDEEDPFLITEDAGSAWTSTSEAARYSAPAPQPEPRAEPRPEARPAPQAEARREARSEHRVEAPVEPEWREEPAPRQSRPRREDRAAAVEEAPRPEPRRPARIGATADADFLAAARNRVGANPGFSDYGSQQNGGGRGRSLVIALSVAGFIAIAGAAGVLVFDSLTGDRPAREATLDEVALAEALTGDNPADINAPAADAGLPPALQSDSQPDPAGDPDLAGPDAAPGAVAPDSAPSEPPARTATAEDAPRNQVASLNNSIPASRPRTLDEAAADGDPVARYQLALERIEAGDEAGAAVLMRRAAEQGVPAAQYRYAKMLERGEGVTADLEEARRWTEMAANAGHRRAMHNMGVMYSSGSGAPQDWDQAAHWFEEAALHGMTDSQFNLAVLYERGLGVPQSAPDAYAWYSIAAAGGDEGAQARANTIRASLSDAAREEADAVIAGFTPRPVNEEANGNYAATPWGQPQSTTPAMVRQAQQLLSALGYQPGPADGVAGAQTVNAVRDFERDAGITPTGQIDAVLIGRLERAGQG
ncbi:MULTISPECIES: peptidoglycan-binding protein [Hyphobacterium]|uniref:Peptidoglycan-binding protein n=1 Tax=Hyphobacterium vulgare TaxID=1736751 RepID=A0ABV6ZY45_9PROT